MFKKRYIFLIKSHTSIDTGIISEAQQDRVKFINPVKSQYSFYGFLYIKIRNRVDVN